MNMGLPKISKAARREVLNEARRQRAEALREQIGQHYEAGRFFPMFALDSDRIKGVLETAVVPLKESKKLVCSGTWYEPDVSRYHLNTCIAVVRKVPGATGIRFFAGCIDFYGFETEDPEKVERIDRIKAAVSCANTLTLN